MVDAGDLKSPGRNPMWVRFPPPASEFRRFSTLGFHPFGQDSSRIDGCVDLYNSSSKWHFVWYVRNNPTRPILSRLLASEFRGTPFASEARHEEGFFSRNTWHSRHCRERRNHQGVRPGHTHRSLAADVEVSPAHEESRFSSPSFGKSIFSADSSATSSGDERHELP